MIETTHTPGPWAVDELTLSLKKLPMVDICARGRTVCELTHHRDPEASRVTQDADARLIAAAPELLHALKWAAEFVSLYTAHGAGWTGVQQANDRGRFINPDNGDLDPEALREFLAQVIDKATCTKGGVDK
tara:strand:+ start:5340 stop:5732 length:393 start_codon:yes stop_codon:yes gene_type:complete